MAHSVSNATKQSTPLSESPSSNGGFTADAKASEQNGDLEEEKCENGEVCGENEEEGEEGEGGQEEEDEEEEDEGDDDNSDDDERAEEKLKDNLRKIEDQLSKKSFVSALEEDKKTQQSFLEEFRTCLGKEPPNKVDNVLHFMAGKRLPSRFLIQYILDHHKDRMNDKDDAGRRPLILAIESNKEVFIQTVLDSKYDDKELEKILKSKSSDAGNGIHKAITEKLNPNLTIDLINKVSNEVLKEEDGEGCTPLHRAVEYERCTEAQIDVVKALLEKGDSALDKRNKAGLSVYRYHFSTRLKEDNASTKPAPNSKLGPDGAPIAPKPRNPSEAVGNSTGDEREKNPIYQKEYLKKEEEEAANRLLQAQSQNIGPGSKFRRTATFKQEDGIKDGMPKPATGPANYQANVSRKTTSTPQSVTTKPLLGTPQTTPEPSKDTIQTKGSKPAARKAGKIGKAGRTGRTRKTGKTGKVIKDMPAASIQFADRIANEVKLQYLRSTFKSDQRNHDTAVEFLYADNQTKHICFNLLQNYKPMSDKSLRQGSYSRFEFDTALQFVAVGPIVAQRQEKPTAFEGRQDMVPLFKWLKGKGVKTIIKVVVDDREDPSHSEEAIIKALGPFNIEILDWSKPDLCPETIRDACKGVRELHLSWSGLNGMLLAWGGTDGLANLPNLTDVYVQQISNLEPEKWTTEKLDNFERRLKNVRDSLNEKRKDEASESQSKDKLTDLPRITVHRPKAQPKVDSQQAANDTGQEQSKEMPIKDHQWLEYMDMFASGIFTLKPDDCIKSISNPPAELRRDVRICLIDDGVDISHKSIMERIEEHGKAFGAYAGDEYRGMTRPFYDSTTNHGTLMANMMVRVCPFAKISSYRLDTRWGEDKRVHFTAKSAADALEYAVKQNFDIISMSWTVREETGPGENNSEAINRIKNALRQATADNKLVFCSAPDTGEMSSDELSSYNPVGSGIANLFRIGAAKADNTPWQQAGGRNIVDYVLPGHDVREKQGDEVMQDDPSLKSGSSIATALAAGLAALMIHVVRMAAIRTYKLGKETSNEANIIKLNSLKTIKLPATMRKIFDSMTGNQMYVHGWGDFYKTGLRLKAAGDCEDPETEKWKIIGELARDIVSSKATNNMHT